MQEMMNDYITAKSPKEKGEPVFKMKTAAGVGLEIILGKVNKAKGLRAVVDAALDEGYVPSSIVFSGDGIGEMVGGNRLEGTDFPGFKIASRTRGEEPGQSQLQKSILEERGIHIPTFTMYTHHPESKMLGDPHPVPNPILNASNLGIIPDITVPDPQANADFVVKITQAARERIAELGSGLGDHATGTGSPQR